MIVLNSSRVSITTILLIAIIISAIGFFFSVTLVDLAVHPAVNNYYEIEGTDFGIYYTSQKPSGARAGFGEK